MSIIYKNIIFVFIILVPSTDLNNFKDTNEDYKHIYVVLISGSHNDFYNKQRLNFSFIIQLTLCPLQLLVFF